MSKKIMILCSSPHKHGNTNTVVDWCVEGAKAAGGEVECVDIARLNYKNNGCIACMGCQKSDKYECVVQDDATEILARIHKYDVLVFATPIYFFGPNAQLKLLMDRMFCLVKFDPETGEPISPSGWQTLGLIATAGGDIKDGLGLLDQTFKAIADFSGEQYLSLLVPNAPMDPQEMKGNAEIKKKALAYGNGLVK